MKYLKIRPSDFCEIHVKCESLLLNQYTEQNAEENYHNNFEVQEKSCTVARAHHGIL